MKIEVTGSLVPLRFVKTKPTRFGPNRPAAEMDGNGEFDFWVIYEEFWRIFEKFWTFGDFWRNRFVVSILRTSISCRPTKKMRF